jgi:hypothetical protein
MIASRKTKNIAKNLTLVEAGSPYIEQSVFDLEGSSQFPRLIKLFEFSLKIRSTLYRTAHLALIEHPQILLDSHRCAVNQRNDSYMVLLTTTSAFSWENSD